MYNYLIYIFTCALPFWGRYAPNSSCPVVGAGNVSSNRHLSLPSMARGRAIIAVGDGGVLWWRLWVVAALPCGTLACGRGIGVCVCAGGCVCMAAHNGYT